MGMRRTMHFCDVRKLEIELLLVDDILVVGLVFLLC